MFQPIPALRNRYTCVRQSATASMTTLQMQFWLYDVYYAENVGFLYIASLNGPARVILVAMTMRKTLLQTYICTHLVGLQDYLLAGVLIHTHTLCMRAAKALASLRMHRLAWALAARRFDKYQNRMCWLKFPLCF